ncbi:radical SAM protein, partial [Candidatus Aerophobetes bacterium]|nr:radical SAM protein [Candidatus Aerophobetes bacterium]
MLELVNAISNGADWKEVKGLTFKEGGETVVTPERPVIDDLDTLPFPARDLLPNHLYRGSIGMKGGLFTLVTASRGCPFKCHFCSTPRFWPALRRRSVGNVLDELEHVCHTYKVDLVRFADEAIVVNKRWLTELCQGMVERGLNEKMAWTCDGRVDVVSEDILEEMKRANCQLIFYGIEFGNQRILDFSGKGMTIAQIHKAIDMTKKAGISPTGNFLLGYPTETRETIEDTIALAKSLDLDFCSFSIVTPFPGSRLYDYCKQNDLLWTENWEEYNYFHPGKGIIKLTDVSDEELMSLYQEARYEYRFRHVK